MIDLADMTIGGFWGPRRESAEDCAGRVLSLIAELGILGGPFQGLQWSRRGRADERVAFTADRAEIAKRLLAGRNRRDTDRVAIEDLGYQVSLDEGRNRFAQARVSFTCGAWTTAVPNSVVIDPPAAGHELPAMWPAAAVRSIVRTFEPDWARVDFSSRLMAHGPRSSLLPTAGWMLYLKVVDRLPALPEPVKVEICDPGILITTIPDSYDPANPDHVEISTEVERRLTLAGTIQAMR